MPIMTKFAVDEYITRIEKNGDCWNVNLHFMGAMSTATGPKP